MKAIIDINDAVCYFLLEDSVSVEILEDKTVLNYLEGKEVIILSDTMILEEGMNEPTNWKPAKYKIIDREWLVNPFYLPYK